MSKIFVSIVEPSAARAIAKIVSLPDTIDGVELRDRPKRDIAELAAPVYADLGAALGPDGELVMVAGNHDHGLVAGWIDGRLETEPSGFLGLEQYLEPADAGPLAAVLAGHAAPARVRVAYDPIRFEGSGQDLDCGDARRGGRWHGLRPVLRRGDRHPVDGAPAADPDREEPAARAGGELPGREAEVRTGDDPAAPHAA